MTRIDKTIREKNRKKIAILAMSFLPLPIFQKPTKY